MVRSAYLYHRQKPAVEEWLNFSAESILGEAVPDNPFLSGETYNEYLTRMDVPVGVFAEMKVVSGRVLKDMERAFLKTANDLRVMTVCLEEGWHDFEGMIRKIAAHFGVPTTDELFRCAAEYDPSRHNFGTHTTQGTLSATEMTGVASIIAGQDSSWFGNAFSSSPFSHQCSALVEQAPTQRASSKLFFDWVDFEA